VIGPLDDVIVVALAFRYAARQIPRSILLDAWPGDRGLLERLLGPANPLEPSDASIAPARHARYETPMGTPRPLPNPDAAGR